MNIYPYGFYLGLRETVADKTCEIYLARKVSLIQTCDAGGRARMRSAPVSETTRLCASVHSRRACISWAYFEITPRCTLLELRHRFVSFRFVL